MDIFGTEAQDDLKGTSGGDTIHGLAGDDILDGGLGGDSLYGGSGDDRYVVDNAGDVVNEAAGEGIDTIQSSVGFALGANFENLTLTGNAVIDGSGNALNNILIGNAAANKLKGGAGDDILDGGLGGDSLYGGSGDDRYVVDNAGDVVNEAAGEGIDTIQSSVGFALGANFENLTLTGNAVIDGSGNALNNILIGNAAANKLKGGAGDDILDGGLGGDSLYGGSGDDRYVVDNAGDVVNEAAGEGIDTIQSSVGFALGANFENLTLTGNAVIDGSGNALNNILIGNAAANKLKGGAGDDILDGGLGGDSLYGGSGDDRYVVDNAGDVVNEAAGEGIDTIQSSVGFALGANFENLTLTGNAVIDGSGNALNNILIGNAAANKLKGGAGDDILDGGLGGDSLYGGSGDDRYVVDNAGDVVNEAAGEGIDTIQSSVGFALGANFENLTLTGNAVIDGSGNALNNILIGNAAANIINGGFGADQITGGEGVDTFEFTSELGSGNIDVIIDFDVGSEHILLGSVFTGLASGTLGAGAFNTGSSATQADDRIIYNTTTGELWFDVDGLGGAAAIHFATLSADMHGLSATNFRVSGPANNSPTITSGSSASIAENSPVDTAVYTATAADPDGDSLTFSLSGAHSDRFTIDPVTGVVRLRSAADFEAQATYNITVVAVDSSGQGDGQDVTVSVTDVAEGGPAYVVAEQEPNDTLATPQSLNRDLFTVTSNANLPESDLPSASVTGTIGHTTDQDFYTVSLQAGELLIVDIDGTTNALDALVRIYGPNGLEIAMNDDLGSLDPGSSNHPQYGHNTDSFVRVRVPTSGLYTISVEAWEGSSSGSYTMHVSVGPQATPAEINEENIDALISGSEWSGLALTYGFTTSASQYPSGHEEAGNNFEALNSSQRTAARSTFGMVSALTNLTFTEATASPGSAQLRLAMSDDPETAHAYYPGEGDGGDSWYNNTGGRYDAPTVGNYAYLTFIHEIGHSLGLKHGHESPALSPDRDSMEFSVMTYRGYIGASGDGGYVNETFGYAQSFMMYDIAALQRMYGANFNTNSGDTIYTWSPTTGAFSVNGTAQNAPGANRVFMTLWDGGGNDTYNLANYSTSVTIDLRPGEWTITSTVQLANLGSGNIARGNVANALLYEGNPASLIENAVGGSAADTIIANQVANRLTGGSGADTFRFHSTSDSGPGSLADIITDFVADSDRIDLSGIDANVNLDGNQAFSFIHNQAFSGIAGQVRYQAVGNNLHIFADTNGDSVADMQIVLNNVSEVRAIDFWL